MTYGHDAQRTSASSAYLSGPLTMMWRYDPVPASATFENVYNAVATTGGVFLHWTQTAPIGEAPSVDGVSNAGKRLWTYDSLRDFDVRHWLAVWGNFVVYNDDGVAFLDLKTGVLNAAAHLPWEAYDLWGPLIPDASGLYMANMFEVDGPAVQVYSLSASGPLRWQKNVAAARGGEDIAGSMVLLTGALYYAASYQGFTSAPPSGFYKFDPATGGQIAFQAARPFGQMSADASQVYSVEAPAVLTARALSDLHVVWSKTIAGIGSQAPVIAHGVIVVATDGDVEAYSAATGAKVWTSAPIFGTAVHFGYLGDASSLTTLAAALGSNALVVVATDGLHILSLADGTSRWSGPIIGVQGQAYNPIIVNDPVRGATVYITDSVGLMAFTPPGASTMQRGRPAFLTSVLSARNRRPREDSSSRASNGASPR